MPRLLRTAAVVCTAALSLVAAGGARALPMQPEDCERAKSEQASLVAGGIGEDMAKGPEWARANLAPERLKRVERWIELEEQLQFRCPRPKPVRPPETAARDADEQQPDKASAPPAKRTTDKSTETGADTPDPIETKPKPPRPKPQKKPKAADAYQPPTPMSGQDMQHAAPGLSVPAGAPALGP